MEEIQKPFPRMLAEEIPAKMLPRILKRFDLTSLYFAIIFGSYGAAQMAGSGWAGISMMVLAAVTFMLPCILAAYELGTLFPGEGGIYVWAHKTAGPIHGFIAGWLSWVPVFLLLPLGATTIVAHLQVVFGTSWGQTTQIFTQCLVVIFVTGVSILNLRQSQNYINLMFFVSAATAVAVFIAGLMNHGAGTPISGEIFSLNLGKYGALYSAAVLWLLGVETPFNMGAEFRDHKKVAGTMFFWGTAALLVAYLLGTAGVLMTTPVADIDVTSGVAKGVAHVWAPGGIIVAIGIIFAVSSQGVAYMTSYSRLLLVSGIERRLPAVFGRVTPKNHVPLAALILQALGGMTVIIIFGLQSNTNVTFNMYVAALTVVWCASLFYLYVGIVRARVLYSNRYTYARDTVWTIPGGVFGVWFVAAAGVFFTALAIYYVFALPLTSDITPGEWRGWLAAISIAVALGGVSIFLAGRKAANRIAALERTL